MDSNAVCLHNATVYAGFSVMKNCAVYIKDGKIADVYNERRFKQKKFSPQVRIIDLMGACSRGLSIPTFTAAAAIPPTTPRRKPF